MRSSQMSERRAALPRHSKPARNPGDDISNTPLHEPGLNIKRAKSDLRVEERARMSASLNNQPKTTDTELDET